MHRGFCWSLAQAGNFPVGFYPRSKCAVVRSLLNVFLPLLMWFLCPRRLHYKSPFSSAHPEEADSKSKGKKKKKNSFCMKARGRTWSFWGYTKICVTAEQHPHSIPTQPQGCDCYLQPAAGKSHQAMSTQSLCGAELTHGAGGDG